ncbi:MULTISPECIES: hypothetical protein [Acinetobacter calcoaceticus/baumannii complex]|nr:MULTISPECIES: hypothetical protein [Acinetobacter calcoaceticus/baumannii complex]MEC6035766.1 hypothetical protein [Acinetobacter nosocomialis]
MNKACEMQAFFVFIEKLKLLRIIVIYVTYTGAAAQLPHPTCPL